MRSCYHELVELAYKVPTTLIWGNHDFNLKHELIIPDVIPVSDRFTKDNIHYCHGWRFDAQQRFAYPLYHCITELCPKLYHKYYRFKNDINCDPNEDSECWLKILNEARKLVDKKKFRLLVMGHTHTPHIDDKVANCGDMVEHSSYVIIEDGVPRLMED